MQKVEENNKLIAEFMGAKWYKNYMGDPPSWKGGDNSISHLLDNAVNLEFHTSWDWLMPVLIKIETLGYNWKLECNNNEESSPTYKCKIGNFDAISGICALDAVWGAIVEFIKMYNFKKD